MCRAQVDTNRGGTIDATEFAAWLSRMEERCWEREEAGIQVAGWERVVQVRYSPLVT